MKGRAFESLAAENQYLLKWEQTAADHRIHGTTRPIEGWGKLIGDVPAVTAILDRFLYHADITQRADKSYRM